MFPNIKKLSFSGTLNTVNKRSIIIEPKYEPLSSLETLILDIFEIGPSVDINLLLPLPLNLKEFVTNNQVTNLNDWNSMYGAIKVLED